MYLLESTIILPSEKLVHTIETAYQQIKGPLPKEFVHFPYLESIHLSHNRFTGTLPQGYSSLSRLSYLALTNNDLTGSIPDGWWDLTKLYFMDLSGNSLTGSIPTQTGTISSLKILRLHDNYFSGTIPTEIGRLSHLCKWSPYKKFVAFPFHFSLPSSGHLFEPFASFLVLRTDFSCFFLPLFPSLVALASWGKNFFEGTIPTGESSGITSLKSMRKNLVAARDMTY